MFLVLNLLLFHEIITECYGFADTDPSQLFHDKLIASYGNTTVEYNLPMYEINALQCLYNATDGPNWLWANASYAGFPWQFTPGANPCVDEWQGIVCTSFPEAGYVHVLALKMSTMGMRGQIPECIGVLNQAIGIFMTTNFLHGPIPQSLGNLSSLGLVDLAYNSLNGSIPQSLANCSALQVITLNNNNLTGSLPGYFSNMEYLSSLVLFDNHLTGTIPTAYGNLSWLEVFNVGGNLLEGTIPASMGNLSLLFLFAVNSNYLSGTIPAELHRLSWLEYIYLDYNGFYGQIPSFLGNLSTLIYVVMNENYLSGTIPVEIAQSSSLQNVYFHTNRLTGTIPAELGQMDSLQLLDLHHNRFVGTIPPELGDLRYLTVLNLYTNFLTGSVPPALGQLSAIQTLDLSQNYLTGIFPDSLGQLSYVVILKIHETQLTGTLPESMRNMTSLSYLSLHTNHFTSTLPAALSRLPNLNALFLYDNLFTGSLDRLLSPRRQTRLAVVQLSQNRLTGQLPNALFALPSLQTVILGSNCFQGSLPLTICNATRLKTLSLDGLRSSSSCQAVMFPGLSGAYVLTQHFKGGIPSCLFEMRSINTLHLSGNGLTGPLPGDVRISGNLVDLSLSHNKLTGTIPTSFQQRIWYNFDLSYNKFKGTFNDEFATVPGNLTVLYRLGMRFTNFSEDAYTFSSSALLLRNNRLSHNLPQVILDMTNVSVLQGNLFGCQVDQHDLPRHDSGKSSYSCGSNFFDISYYIYIGVLCVALTAAATLYLWRYELVRYFDVTAALQTVQRWLAVIDSYDGDSGRGKSRLHRYKYVTLLFDEICRIAAYCTLYIVVVMLPVYCVLSKLYGTHKFEYAWSVSAAFLSGAVSLALLLVFFCVLLVILLLAFKVLIHTMKSFLRSLPRDFHFSVLDSFQDEAGAEGADNRYSSLTEKALVYAVFFLLNVGVVGAANIGYVYTAIYSGSSYQILAQLGLSVFKIVWSNFGSIYLIRWTHHQLASSSTKEWKSKGAGFFAIQLFVALFNYIIVPCVVVAAISPNCFNNAFVAAPTVTSYFYYEQCQVYSALFGCVVPEIKVASTSYSPPFTYSYECSSSLITYYAPMFVYMGFLITFVSPLWDELMRQAHIRASRGTWWFATVDFWAPPVLHPVSAATVQFDQPYDIFNPYIDANYLLVTITSYLGVLLTFGFVFPPLAVVMLAAICSTVYVSRLEVGRFLSDAISDGVHKYSDIIESECQGVGSVPKLIQAIRIIVVFSCLFYTPFLFDTLGDSVGIGGTYWVLIVVPLLPLVVYIAHFLYRQARIRTERGRETSIELRSSTTFPSAELGGALAAAMREEQPPEHRNSRLSAMRGKERQQTQQSQQQDDESEYTLNVLQKAL